MAKYIGRRLLVAIPLLFVISILVFMLMKASPYDVVDTMIDPKMSAETIAAIRAKYCLDKPVIVQYFNWLGGILQGDFGYSIATKQSIGQQLQVRIPATIMLVLPSYLVAYVLSIVLGLVAKDIAVLERRRLGLVGGFFGCRLGSLVELRSGFLL